MKGILVFLLLIVSGVYLINPTAGVFEFIPDNVPIIGNLDEAAAVTLILNCFRYWGIDITNLFTPKNSPPNSQTKAIEV